MLYPLSYEGSVSHNRRPRDGPPVNTGRATVPDCRSPGRSTVVPAPARAPMWEAAGQLGPILTFIMAIAELTRTAVRRRASAWPGHAGLGHSLGAAAPEPT
jgi:hypothetical protein